METCGGCRFWAGINIEDKMPVLWGRCKAMPETGEMTEDWSLDSDNEIDYRVDGEVKAYTEDASRFHSSLITRRDFGCVLFEPKPDPPSGG